MTVPGYHGWRQRTPDFGHSSLGGPPPPEHGPRRRATLPLALIAVVGLLAAVAIFLVRADGADDDRVAAEIEERSQPPVLNEARLVEDRLELDVAGPDDAEYCLDSSVARSGDSVGPLCSRGVGDPQWFAVDDLAADADELVGREIVVTARSTVSTGAGGLVSFSGEVVSGPSDPVEIVDTR